MVLPLSNDDYYGRTIVPLSNDDHYGQGSYLREICQAYQLPPYSEVIQLRAVLGICKVIFFFGSCGA